MNQLLKTIDITRNKGTFEEIAAKIEADIHIIAIDSDLFFTAQENKATYEELKKYKNNVSYQEIKSTFRSYGCTYWSIILPDLI